MDTDDPVYTSWLGGVPHELTDDPIWRLPAYRLALFLTTQARADIARIAANTATRPFADQLVRAVGSISANIAEGYGRSFGRERAHLYEYALGSAREARDWYFHCADSLPQPTLEARLACLTRIIRILTAVIPRERRIRIDDVVNQRRAP